MKKRALNVALSSYQAAEALGPGRHMYTWTDRVARDDNDEIGQMMATPLEKRKKSRG